MKCTVLHRLRFAAAINYVTKRSIAGQYLRELHPRPPKPKPYPYQTKKYNFWNYMDKTSDRLDENSKVIIVEGPIAAGKTRVAKALAEEFDMLYMPEANMDMYHINQYGFDMRSLNKYLPKNVQAYDVPSFFRNPYDRRSFMMQLNMFVLRYSLYFDGLAHLLSTGQGIVLDRSPFTEYVFVDSFHRFGYYTNEFKNLYCAMMKRSLRDLLMPHLVVYLDVPHDIVMKRIKERNRPFEVKSEVLSEPFLKYFENSYKQLIKDMEIKSEVLVYDWSEIGDIEPLVENIEALDFDTPAKIRNKFKDWYLYPEMEWRYFRQLYADERETMIANITNTIHLDVPEVFMSTEDQIIYDRVMLEHSPMTYEDGYNPEFGDKVIFSFKSEYQRHMTSRREHNYDSLKD